MITKNAIRNSIILFLYITLAILLSYYLYRFIYLKNFREVIPGVIYRSAQPTANELQGWQGKYHFNSLLSLRGHQNAGPIKKAYLSASKLGIQTNIIKLSSRRLPYPKDLQTIINVINNSPKPLLIHCMRGVDRSGLISAIALILNNQTIEQAREEFSWTKGFLPYRKQELLITLIDNYEHWLKANDLNTSKENFMIWSDSIYPHLNATAIV